MAFVFLYALSVELLQAFPVGLLGLEVDTNVNIPQPIHVNAQHAAKKHDARDFRQEIPVLVDPLDAHHELVQRIFSGLAGNRLSGFGACKRLAPFD